MAFPWRTIANPLACFQFLVFSPLISLFIWLAVLFVLLYIRDRIRGFTIYTKGDKLNELIYREFGIGSLDLWIADALPRYVEVPSEAEWEHEMPDWAKARRVEIMRRITDHYAWDKSMHFINEDGSPYV